MTSQGNHVNWDSSLRNAWQHMQIKLSLNWQYIPVPFNSSI